ncbi:MAG: hypothetical protein IPN81_06870 [Nitrosomonadales bacterium]|nr:hypothetical protein [Nitrosomonadales bacterium]
MPQYKIQSILFALVTLAASHAHAIDFGDLINKELGKLDKSAPQNQNLQPLATHQQ